MARSKRSSGASSVQTRRDFADENIARLHFSTNANNAIRAEVLQRFIAEVRDVTRDFLRSELRVAGATSNSSM